MIFEPIGAADIGLHRALIAMPGHPHDAPDPCSVLCCQSDEAGAQGMTKKLIHIAAGGGILLHDQRN